MGSKYSYSHFSDMEPEIQDVRIPVQGHTFGKRQKYYSTIADFCAVHSPCFQQAH